jgi:hypothetical protein
MAGGPLTFSGNSTAGVLNLGTIHAALGDVALFAPTVANHGTIEAPNGTAALVSGREILFAPGADSFYIKAPVAGADGQTAIDNSGVIKAAQVELKAAGSAYALAVNANGVISATAVKQVGGRVILDAGDGDASVSGTMTARAGDDGGTIAIHGGQVDVASGATLQADATGHGHGGSVTVLADGETRFNGLIEARGGAKDAATPPVLVAPVDAAQFEAAERLALALRRAGVATRLLPAMKRDKIFKYSTAAEMPKLVLVGPDFFALREKGGEEQRLDEAGVVAALSR